VVCVVARHKLFVDVVEGAMVRNEFLRCPFYGFFDFVVEVSHEGGKRRREARLGLVYNIIRQFIFHDFPQEVFMLQGFEYFIVDGEDGSYEYGVEVGGA